MAYSSADERSEDYHHIAFIENRVDLIEEALEKYMPRHIWREEIARHHNVFEMLGRIRRELKFLRQQIDGLLPYKERYEREEGEDW